MSIWDLFYLYEEPKSWWGNNFVSKITEPGTITIAGDTYGAHKLTNEATEGTS